MEISIFQPPQSAANETCLIGRMNGGNFCLCSKSFTLNLLPIKKLIKSMKQDGLSFKIIFNFYKYFPTNVVASKLIHINKI